jgi:hypothetical protein
MRWFWVLILALSPVFAYAQAPTLAPPAAPQPQTACSAPTTTAYCFTYWNNGWQTGIVTAGSGVSFAVTGNNITITATGGGGGGTYTNGACISIVNNVISIKAPTVQMTFTSNNHTVAAGDMCSAQIATITAPSTVTFPNAGPLVASGLDFCVQNDPASTAVLSFIGSGATVAGLQALNPGQGACPYVKPDNVNWLVFKTGQ